jgi:Uma2 family endonuclease
MIVRQIDDPLQVSVPAGAHTLDGFCEWVTSPSFPEKGDVAFLQGEVWIDMSPEDFQSHTKVKTNVASVLDAIVSKLGVGDLYGDGGLITNDEAGLSTVPDALFVSYRTLKSGRAEYVARGAGRGRIELRGSPDWVLEVVSPTSERKDLELLPDAYHKAGVKEYWVIDARDDRLELTIYVHRKKGYRAVKPQKGWLTSPVFRRQFRLERKLDEVGGWVYNLRVRAIRKS